MNRLIRAGLNGLAITALLLGLFGPAARFGHAEASRLDPALARLAAATPAATLAVIIQQAAATDRVEAQVTALGGTVTKRLRLINALAAEVPAQAVEALGRSAEVRWVSLDAPVYDASVREQAAPLCGVNLLSNPGFEHGLLGFEAWAGRLAVSTDRKAGQSAAVISGAADGTGQWLSAEPGQTYALSGWFRRSADQTEWTGAGLDFMDSNGQEIGEAYFDITSATYAWHSVSGVAPAGTRYVALWVWKDGATGALFMDELMVQTPCGAGQTAVTPQYACANTGAIRREYWTNAAGYTVDNIPTHEAPTGVDNLPFLETYANWGEAYGQRLRGYLCAPATGAYTFWIAGDDQSELWLSTDASPLNKTRLAYVSGWTDAHAWYATPEQQSQTVWLVAGQQYYLEVLHKEGFEGDHVAVAWKGPTTPHQVIPGAALSPYTDSGPVCSLNLLANPGFEADLSGWGTSGALSVVTDKYSGAKALRVGPIDSGFSGANIPAQAGETFVVSGWGKIANSPEWAALGLDFFDANGLKIGQIGADLMDAVWTRGSVSGVTPEGTAYLVPWVWKSGGTGTLTVDDLVVQECTAVAAPGAATATSIDVTKLKTVYNQAIRSSQAWNLTARLQGQGVTVAVVDSGIDPGSDFSTGAGQNRVVAQVRFNTDANRTTFDGYGHGNHVAGIIGGNGRGSAGQYVGVAPAVNLVNVKVSNNDGSSTLSSVIEGLQWIYDNRHVHNIRVVNISLNSSQYESYHTSPLNAAVEVLWFNEIVVVVSAGNNGTATLFPPANDPFVITVGAVDDRGTASRSDDLVASFSAYGTTGEGMVKPDLVAPGKNIVAVKGNSVNRLAADHPGNVVATSYFKMSGTSMAAPMVAGAAALLLQDEPGLTPDQVKYRLMATANKSWAGYTSAKAGAGYLDAYAAVNGATTQSANTGVPASQMLWTGADPVAWNSVSWSSVSWSSVSWSSVSWSSVSWSSVSWSSDYWGP